MLTATLSTPVSSSTHTLGLLGSGPVTTTLIAHIGDFKPVTNRVVLPDTWEFSISASERLARHATILVPHPSQGITSFADDVRDRTKQSAKRRRL
jgi:hypothetical protein